jgi:hypothetical protein
MHYPTPSILLCQRPSPVGVAESRTRRFDTGAARSRWGPTSDASCQWPAALSSGSDGGRRWRPQKTPRLAHAERPEGSANDASACCMHIPGSSRRSMDGGSDNLKASPHGRCAAPGFDDADERLHVSHGCAVTRHRRQWTTMRPTVACRSCLPQMCTQGPNSPQKYACPLCAEP